MTWKQNILAFDTETTGTGEDARIVEIAFMQFVDLRPVRDWSWLMWPEGVNWEDEGVKQALAVNGLTQRDFIGKPTFQDMFSVLMDVMKYSPVWVAHNASFDLRMLRQERLRLGDPKSGKFVPRPLMVLDTMTLDCVLKKGKYKRRLGEVAKRRKVEQLGAHRALDDARVCGEILIDMIPSLPDDLKELSAIQSQGNAIWDKIMQGYRDKDAAAAAAGGAK